MSELPPPPWITLSPLVQQRLAILFAQDEEYLWLRYHAAYQAPLRFSLTLGNEYRSHELTPTQRAEWNLWWGEDIRPLRNYLKSIGAGGWKLWIIRNGCLWVHPTEKRYSVYGLRHQKYDVTLPLPYTFLAGSWKSSPPVQFTCPKPPCP